jgi:hypothetical protein
MDERTGVGEPIEEWARRGTRRLIWAYSIAAGIAIAAAVAYKDSRYIVQVVVGVGLVAYFLSCYVQQSERNQRRPEPSLKLHWQ